MKTLSPYLLFVVFFAFTTNSWARTLIDDWMVIAKKLETHYDSASNYHDEVDIYTMTGWTQVPTSDPGPVTLPCDASLTPKEISSEDFMTKYLKEITEEMSQLIHTHEETNDEKMAKIAAVQEAGLFIAAHLDPSRKVSLNTSGGACQGGHFSYNDWIIPLKGGQTIFITSSGGD